MFSRTAVMPVLLVGPLATVLGVHDLVGTSWLATPMLRWALLGALMVWSPLFFSLPALLLQDARDAVLDHWRGPVGTLARAVVLLPYLCCSKKSPCRPEAIASVIGFGVALLAALAIAA